MIRRRATRYAMLAIVSGFYFGSLWVAACLFPGRYDWRSNVISNLLSPRDNPHYYWLPCLGMALAGLCMLPLLFWIENELGDAGSRMTRYVRRPAFLVGAVCLILAALVVPQHVHPLFGMRRLHESLARTSAAGLGTGMLCACWSLTARAPVSIFPHARRRRRMGLAWGVATLGPLAGLAVSEVLILLARSAWFPHGQAISQALRGTMLWRLAFWEWLGSAVVFFFLASSVLWLATEPPERQSADRLN